MQAYRYSFIDRTGKVLIDASKYDGAGSFSNGLAYVFLRDKKTNLSLNGFIDKTGKEAIVPQPHRFGSFSEGLAKVEIGGKWGFIDLTGRIVIKPAYDIVNEFSESVAVAVIGRDILLIDRNGRKIWSKNMDVQSLNVYDYPGAKYSEGVVVASAGEDQKYGFIDKAGRFVIEPKFTGAGPFSEGLARVGIVDGEDEKLGFIDHHGQFVIPPRLNTDWDFRRNSTDFSEGLASVTENLRPSVTEEEKFVFIDKTGEIVLFTDFFYAGPFREGLAVVYTDDERDGNGFIDKSGNVVIPIQYDIAADFSEGLACVATLVS